MHPFLLIPHAWRRRLVAAAGVSAGLFAFLLLLWNRELGTPTAPRGMYDLELARTPQRAAAILDSWSIAPTFSQRSRNPADAIQGHSSARPQMAQSLLLLGFLFLPFYVCALGMAAAWLSDVPGAPNLGIAAAWAPFLAALADAVENTLLLRLLQPPLDAGLVAPIFWIAVVKFLLLLFPLAWIWHALRSAGRRWLSAIPALVFGIVLAHALESVLRSGR